MVSYENEEIVRGMYDAFNAKDIRAFEALSEPDAQMTSYAFGQTGPARDYLQNWMTGFPDGEIEVRNIVIGDPWCVTEFIGRGTQTGQLRTPFGVIEPSGRRVEIHMCELLRIENGKIRESRSYFDVAGFFAQLGVGAYSGRAETSIGSTDWEEEQPALH